MSGSSAGTSGSTPPRPRTTVTALPPADATRIRAHASALRDLARRHGLSHPRVAPTGRLVVRVAEGRDYFDVGDFEQAASALLGAEVTAVPDGALGNAYVSEDLLAATPLWPRGDVGAAPGRGAAGVRPARGLLLELRALLEQVERLAGEGRDRYDASLERRLALQRLWVAIGNAAEECRVLVGIAPGEQPWARLVRLRNRLAHQHLGDIDDDEVWRTGVLRPAGLQEAVQRLIQEGADLL